MLRDAGIGLSAVGSDLGKIRITDPFEDHLKRAAHAMDVCEFFECPRLRTFSFFMPEGEDFGQVGVGGGEQAAVEVFAEQAGFLAGPVGRHQDFGQFGIAQQQAAVVVNQQQA